MTDVKAIVAKAAAKPPAAPRIKQLIMPDTGTITMPANCHLVQTAETWDRMLEELHASRHIVFDVETTGLDWKYDKICGWVLYTMERRNAYYVPVRHAAESLGSSYRNASPEVVSGQLNEIFTMSGKRLIPHHGKFDTHFSREDGVNTLLNLWYDTMVGSQLLNENESHSLKDLAVAYGLDPHARTYTEFFGNTPIYLAPLLSAAYYASKDGVLTGDLLEFQWPYLFGGEFPWQPGSTMQLPTPDLAQIGNLFWTEMEVVRVCIDMETNGVCLNKEYMGELNVQATIRLDELTDEMHTKAGDAALEYHNQVLEQAATIIHWYSRKSHLLLPDDVEKAKTAIVELSGSISNNFGLGWQNGSGGLNTELLVSAMYDGAGLPGTKNRSLSDGAFKKMAEGVNGDEMKQRLIGACRFVIDTWDDYQKLKKTGKFEYKITSPAKVSMMLFDVMGMPEHPEDGRSTAEKTLKWLAKDRGYKYAADLLDYREFAKLKSSFIEALPEQVWPVTNRIHCNFNPQGAKTGRFSCSGPNWQQMPKFSALNIRKAIYAPDGKLLWDGDYSQIELRVLAHYSKDPVLMDAYLTGKDIHTVTACMVFKHDYVDFTFALADDTHPMHNLFNKQRKFAKTINFGLIYGMGPRALAANLGIGEGEARQFIDAYFKAYPTVRGFLDAAIEFCATYGYVQTLGGRKRRLPEVWSSDYGEVAYAKRQAGNALIQGSAADIMKRAMAAMRPLQFELGFDMLMTIHDEMVLEIPQCWGELHEETKQQEDGSMKTFQKWIPVREEPQILADVMATTTKLLIPTPVDFKLLKTLGDAL